jgi:hypothetical protein
VSGGRRRKKPEKPPAQSVRREPRTSAHDSAKKPAAPAPATGSLFDSRILGVALGLIAACVAVFASVRHNDFVYYDDPKYVTENPIVL